MFAFAHPARLARRLMGLIAVSAALAGGAASADSGTVVVDDVTFDIGIAKYSAKHLELTGSKLSASEFKELLTSLAKGATADSLARLDATSIVIPDLAFEQDFAGNHQLAHYLNVELHDIHAGVVGSYAIASGVMGGELAGGQTTTGAMRKMGGTGIDLPEIARVFSTGNSDASAPQKPLYGTAFGDGFDFKTPLLEMRIGRSTMSDIRGRPLKRPIAEILNDLPKPKTPGQPLSPEDQKAALAFVPELLDLYAAFSIGKMEMHDLSVSSHGDAEHHMPPFAFTVSRIALSDYGNSRIGDMSIEGIKVVPPNGKFELGQLALRGFDFREAMVGLAKFTQAAAAKPSGAPPSPDDLKLMKMPRLEALTLAGLSADFKFPSDPSDPDSPARPIKFSLASFELKPELWADGLPKSILTKTEHLIFSLPPEAPNAEAFVAAGFDTLDVSSNLDAGWDEQTQRLTVGAAHLEAKDLAAVTLATTTDNVPPEAFNGDQFTRQAAWLGGLLKSLDLKIENQKLYDILFAIQGKQTNTSADQAKSNLIATAAVMLPQMLGNSPNAKALGDAIAKFLADPKSLHITLVSKDGIGAADAAAPQHILDNVDLTATAN